MIDLSVWSLSVQELSVFSGPLLRLAEVRRLRRRLAWIQVSRSGRSCGRGVGGHMTTEGFQLHCSDSWFIKVFSHEAPGDRSAQISFLIKTLQRAV